VLDFVEQCPADDEPEQLALFQLEVLMKTVAFGHSRPKAATYAPKLRAVG